MFTNISVLRFFSVCSEVSIFGWDLKGVTKNVTELWIFRGDLKDWEYFLLASPVEGFVQLYYNFYVSYTVIHVHIQRSKCVLTNHLNKYFKTETL